MHTVWDAPTEHRSHLYGLTGRTGEPPAVSVCIANWNCRELLRRCLTSLFTHNQGVSFEVIVVDNSSTDGAAEMVAREFPQVCLVRNRENLGFSRASNQAAALARGRHLFFLNNDTELAPQVLGDLVQYADTHPTVGMLGPRLRGGDGIPQVSYRQRPTLGALLHRISLLRWTGLFRRAYYRYRREHFNPEGVRPVEVLLGAAVLIPRRVFERVGRWDERYPFGVEDFDLSTRVGRFARVVYLSDVEVIHYGRMSSRMNGGFTTAAVAVGFVQYLRMAGAGEGMLYAYKMLVLLDVPVQIVGKLLQGAVRWATGRPEKARKSWLSAAGFCQFFHNNLGRFWRA